jgi:hypothetical protein
MSHQLSLYRALLALSDPQLPDAERVPCEWLLEGWPQLLTLADAHGVLGLVLHNLDKRSAGSEVAGLPRARQSWRAQLVKTMKLRQFGQQLMAALIAAEVPAVLLKGPDFADHLYPQPALRPTRDLDLLVPQDRWPEAHTVLRQFGLRVARRHAGRTLTQDYGEQAWRREPFDGTFVDLHWNFIDKAGQRRRLRTAFDDWNWAKQPAIGGVRLVSTPEIRLVIAALHATISHQFERLLHLSDLRQAARQLAEADLAKLQELLDRTRTQQVLAVALAVVARVLSDESSARLAARLRGCRPNPPLASRLITIHTVLGTGRPLAYVRRRLLREWLKLAA